MTELREKIIRKLRPHYTSCMFCSLEGQCFNNDVEANRAKGEYRRNPLLCVAAQRDADFILTLTKDSGYVRLSDDQSLPKIHLLKGKVSPQERQASLAGQKIAQQDMLKDYFRRLELPKEEK